MNWYKKSQIAQQYTQNLEHPMSDVKVIGSGMNHTINIPGGTPISAKDLLNMAVQKVKPVLIQNHVHTIDTSPIGKSDVQGLSSSHEVGIIHVDLPKIFNTVRTNLNTNSTQTFDKSSTDSIVDKVSSYLLGELGETMLHESAHFNSFTNLFQQGRPFSEETEQHAVQFGQEGRKKYFSETVNQ